MGGHALLPSATFHRGPSVGRHWADFADQPVLLADAAGAYTRPRRHQLAADSGTACTIQTTIAR